MCKCINKSCLSVKQTCVEFARLIILHVMSFHMEEEEEEEELTFLGLPVISDSRSIEISVCTPAVVVE